MKYETSSGGVVVRLIDNHYKALLLKDKNGQWTFPKGLIEKGEDLELTARREIEEEVGIGKLKLLSLLTPIEYFYKWEGTLVKKKVYYFMFINEGREKVKPQLDEGIMGVKWMPFAQALEIVGYKKTNLKLLKEAKEKLELDLNHET